MPEMGLWDLIHRAEGLLLPDAYRPVAHVLRLNPEDGDYTPQRVSLETDDDGEPVDSFELVDLDQDLVYGRAALRTGEQVSISGSLKNPGDFPYAEGMTL